MRRSVDCVHLEVGAGALVLFAALLLLLPVQWVMGMVLAAAVHECFHALAVYLMGGKILRLSIGTRGALMEATPMQGASALACSLAGPAGSMLLLLFVRWLPRTALCGLIQGCYNLLPLLPLDGGRAMSCLLELLLSPERAAGVMRVIQISLRLLLLSLAAWTAVRTGIWLLFAVAALLCLSTAEIKLAKKPIWRYNRHNIDKGVRL